MKGEILQHEVQTWAQRLNRRAAVKQPFNKALKCHRLGHIKKKSYENKRKENTCGVQGKLIAISFHLHDTPEGIHP